MAREHAAADTANVGVLHDLWRTKLWRIIPMFFVYITCAPHLCFLPHTKSSGLPSMAMPSEQVSPPCFQ